MDEILLVTVTRATHPKMFEALEKLPTKKWVISDPITHGVPDQEGITQASVDEGERLLAGEDLTQWYLGEDDVPPGASEAHEGGSGPVDCWLEFLGLILDSFEHRPSNW